MTALVRPEHLNVGDYVTVVGWKPPGARSDDPWKPIVYSEDGSFVGSVLRVKHVEGTILVVTRHNPISGDDRFPIPIDTTRCDLRRVSPEYLAAMTMES